MRNCRMSFIISPSTLLVASLTFSMILDLTAHPFSSKENVQRPSTMSFQKGIEYQNDLEPRNVFKEKTNLPDKSDITFKKEQHNFTLDELIPIIFTTGETNILSNNSQLIKENNDMFSKVRISRNTSDTNGTTLGNTAASVDSAHPPPHRLPLCPKTRVCATPHLASKHRIKCHCDMSCEQYCACCRSHQSAPHLANWTCVAQSNKPNFQGVYVVDFCTTDSHVEDVRLCQLTVPTEEYTAILDIPVFPPNNSIKYQNTFCALCHKETTIKYQMSTVTCTPRLKNRQLILDMMYNPLSRMWIGNVHNSQIDIDDISYTPDNLLEETSNSSDHVNVTCFLHLEYEADVGQKCHPDKIQYSDKRPCVPPRGYVRDSGGNMYKNIECAICNAIEKNSLSCHAYNNNINQDLETELLYNRHNISFNSGDCERKGKWSFGRSLCSDIECAGVVLKNTTCNLLPIELQLSTHDRSHISFYCFSVTYETGNITMISNNSIYVSKSNKLYKYGEYEITKEGSVRVCRFNDHWTPTMTLLSRCLISISLAALAMHMFIFIALPKKRNTPSKTLFSLSLSLFIVELIFVTAFYATENRTFCTITSVVMYYFLCSSFLWMNILSIDICRTFYSTSFKIKPHKLFIQYSIYAWVVPVICSSIALIMHVFAPEDFIIHPEFGTHRCWFNNKWGLVTFFTFPAGLIVIINMILFIISVISIYRQHMEGQLASVTIQKSNSYTDVLAKQPKSSPKIPHQLEGKQRLSMRNIFNGNSDIMFKEKLIERMHKRLASHRKLKIRLILYCKLAIIMGMTWIFAFISIHTKSLTFEYLFIVFNGLQGTFIFLAFDCKKKVWKDLRNQFSGTTTSNNSSRFAGDQQSSFRRPSASRWDGNPVQTPKHETDMQTQPADTRL